MKRFSHFCWRSSWRAARLAFTGPGKINTKKSSDTATAKSTSSGKKSPSLCLGLAALALGISALLMLEAEEGPHPQLLQLELRGWTRAGLPECEGLEQGFYELESDSDSLEFFLLDGETILASRPPPWPDPPYLCRPVSKPAFIQEIL